MLDMVSFQPDPVPVCNSFGFCRSIVNQLDFGAANFMIDECYECEIWPRCM